MAPGSQRVQPHDRVTDVQLGARPLALARPSTPRSMLAAERQRPVEGRNRAVVATSTGQNIEAIEAVPGFEPGITAGRSRAAQALQVVPRSTVDQRVAVDPACPEGR